MLSPEVWTFPAPKSTFKDRFGNLVDNNIAVKEIQDFYYNHLVSVVVPNTITVPRDLINFLATDSDYYKVDNLNISELIDTDFIKYFVRNGRVTLLSVGTKIDTDDCICLTPTGVLILSLKKNTFVKLGLKGIVSHFTDKTKDRYNTAKVV